MISNSNLKRKRTQNIWVLFLSKTFSKKRFQFYKFTIDKGYRSDYYSSMKALTFSCASRDRYLILKVNTCGNEEEKGKRRTFFILRKRF
ncbi:hypothetical protein QF049_005553 [Paenibacillus sp. W4I10]|nr:hypothetical protein [Paenibacillus sp. W4I10]